MSPGSEGGVEHVLVRHVAMGLFVVLLIRSQKRKLDSLCIRDYRLLPGGIPSEFGCHMNSINEFEAGSARGGILPRHVLVL